jgi:bisphosphoglycerate-dependent phosphoglycerate mutase
MSEEQKREIAKQYVDRQLETMKEYDSAPPDLSEEEYQSLISETAELVQS